MDERLEHLTENERAALAALVERLRQRYGDDLLRVVLFGSKARGDFDAESDLDVLVVVRLPEENYWRHWSELVDNTYDLDLKYNVVLSLLVKEATDYARMCQWNALIHRNIEKDGIELWTSLQNAPFIRVRLDKAQEDLSTAREMLRVSRWRGAVNRAYYAVFHIASASLLWIDVERTKHSAVMASFNQLFVNNGLVEVGYGQFYKKAREWREEQDYSDVARPLDEPTAVQIVADAGRFVERLERYLREVGAI